MSGTWGAIALIGGFIVIAVVLRCTGATDDGLDETEPVEAEGSMA